VLAMGGERLGGDGVDWLGGGQGAADSGRN